MLLKYLRQIPLQGIPVLFIPGNRGSYKQGVCVCVRARVRVCACVCGMCVCVHLYIRTLLYMQYVCVVHVRDDL